MALKNKNDEFVSNYPVRLVVLAIWAFAGIGAGVIAGIGPLLFGTGITQAISLGVITGVVGFILNAYASLKFGQNIRRLVALNVVMIAIAAVFAFTGSFYSAIVAYIIAMIIAIFLPEK